jgi:hypothetical protein
MTAKEKRWKSWARLIDEQANSGQSATAWCHEKGINVKTFGRWKHSLWQADEKQLPAETRAGWCQIIQAKPVVAPADGLKLVIDGRITIELEPKFNHALLAEVLEVLCR